MPKKQSDGRYRAKLTIGYTAEGKAIYKYLSASTKYELERMKEEARKHYIDGAVIEQDHLFEEYAIQWYRVHKEPHIGKSTQSDYRTIYNNYLLPTFSGRMIRSIRSIELQSWINGFAGKSRTRITLALAIIHGIFRCACQDNILERDPSAHLVTPKAGEAKKKRALTMEERAAVLKTIGEHQEGLLLSVFYYLGLRRGEALGLRWGDFDWETSTVHIQRDVDFTLSRKRDNKDGIGDLKTVAANRDVVIPRPLYDALHIKRGFPQIYLFSGRGGIPLSRASFERKWLSLMIHAGLAEKLMIPAERKRVNRDIRMEYQTSITPHYLRHNYVTMLHEAGIDPLIATRMVGHSSYSTTANIYTHLNNMHIRSAQQKLDAVFER